jgi:hypothetical protein
MGKGRKKGKKIEKRKSGGCCSFQSFDYFPKAADTHASTNSRRRCETAVYRRAVDSFDTSYLLPQTLTNVERRTQMFSSAHSTIKKRKKVRKNRKKGRKSFDLSMI